MAHKRISQVFQGHKSEIYSLAFSPDGRRLVSGSGDKTAKMWDLETGTCVYTLAIEDITIAENGPVDAGVTSVVFSPDGKFLAAGSLDTMVRIWDAETGVLLDKLKGHRDSVYSVAFSPDGKFLVSGSLDKTLKMFDIGSLKAALAAGVKDAPVGEGGKTTCLTTLQGHKVRRAAFRCFRRGRLTPAHLGICSLPVRAGLRALGRHLAGRRVDRVGLEGPRRAILGPQDGQGSVHAAGAQELGCVSSRSTPVDKCAAAVRGGPSASESESRLQRADRPTSLPAAPRPRLSPTRSPSLASPLDSWLPPRPRCACPKCVVVGLGIDSHFRRCLAGTAWADRHGLGRLERRASLFLPSSLRGLRLTTRPSLCSQRIWSYERIQ